MVCIVFWFPYNLYVFYYKELLLSSSRQSLRGGVCVTTLSVEVGVPTIAFVALSRTCRWTRSILGLASNDE